MISLETLAHPPLWVHLSIWLPLVTILGIAFIQPVKGGVMALQWWLAEGGEGTEEGRNPLIPAGSEVRVGNGVHVDEIV